MSAENLYLRIENGVPISHPVIESNLRQFFPDCTIENPPEGFVRFERLPMPELGPYQVYDHTTYEPSNFYTDLYNQLTYADMHHVRDMSLEERDKIIAEFKQMNPELQSWVFDENTHTLVPPIPKPDDGKDYIWLSVQNQWIEKPSDLDFAAMMDAAAEMGYDMRAGRFGMPTFDEPTVNEIINKVKEEEQQQGQ